MARTSRPRRTRGSFGQWTTYDRTGAARDQAGWDAVTLAAIDGGGCLHPRAHPAGHPVGHADTADPAVDEGPDRERARDRRRRTASVARTARTTRQSRRGGRR